MRPADARHLLRRFAFAATPGLERALSVLTPGKAVPFLVVSSRQAPRPAPPVSVRGEWSNSALRFLDTTDAEHAAQLATQTRAAGLAIEALRQWWLDEMIRGEAPLREMLVLFFQDTLGSSSALVGIPHALYGCNALLRVSCLESIPTLLDRLVIDPAMMMQIGMDGHEKERVSDTAAKRILDYWTVGPGEYTDRDVEELSRALTGWTLAAAPGQRSARAVHPNADRTSSRTGLVPTFRSDRFDAGHKTILGVTRRFDARTAIRLLASHPATGRRYGRRLIRYFGVEDPVEQLERRMAETYHATYGSVEALLHTLVRSDQFWSPATRWSQIKSPVHLVVGACRQLEISSPALPVISRWLTAAGQTLFDTSPTAEGGWTRQEGWVTPPDRLTVRYQLPTVLAGRMPSFGLGSSAPGPSAAPVFSLPDRHPLVTASIDTVFRRLDPAPEVNPPEFMASWPPLESTGAIADLIRRVMTTPEYQLA